MLCGWACGCVSAVSDGWGSFVRVCLSLALHQNISKPAHALFPSLIYLWWKADIGSSRRPLKSHRLAAAVISHDETLLVGTVHMAVTKVQHLIITCEREIGWDKKQLSMRRNCDTYIPFLCTVRERLLLWILKVICQLIFLLIFFRLFASLPSSRQEDRFHFFNCACSNKKEPCRARQPLISLAQILVVNGKC